MKTQGEILYKNVKVHEETVDRINRGLVEDENFIKEAEVEKNNSLLIFYRTREEKGAKLRAEWEKVKQFMKEVQRSVEEFYKQF